MESISLDKREVVLDILHQIKESIENLMRWNQGITDMNQLLMSPSGVQDLAGNCMTIMAIGEGFRKYANTHHNPFLIILIKYP